ncbi:unnamed protein product [Bursaphelenchus xylophilus]|uniref:(pine wood nematode) hypothetical protein n=1 Tax=Bursaphelenchus xylophilus TaxID=6326 RepID=A0A1I7SMG2_BURXY|nr:unnamed protein product [Bursaphelenchus xylophilus]CAG9130182.1 unnamed protein product [Bursaphelenchus xylophilus]
MNKTTIVNILTVVNLVFIVFYCFKSPDISSTSQPISSPPSLQANIVVYNRIPKTGSTTFTNAIGYDLFKKNGFNVIHVNITKNMNTLSAADQADFVRNVSDWNARKPALYHGHMAFLNFNRFGRRNPIYINILREPLERFVSYYYFLRYGDNYRVGLKRSRSGNNETFDECIQRKGRDCDLDKLWVQIPYFCGHYSFCKKPGNRLAFETARSNLINHYLLVGYTDKIREMILVLEKVLPTFFSGALNHFDQLDGNRSHMRSTTKKIEPKRETLEKISKNSVFIMEKEFYEFAVSEFDATFDREIENKHEKKYRYEKMRP